MSICGLLLLILFLIFTVSTAEIKNLKIIDDTRSLILFKKFGFTHGGHVDIAVKDVSFHSSVGQLDPNLLGFFLISDEELLRIEYDPQYQNPNPNSDGSGFPSNSNCILSSPHVVKLFTFNDLAAASNSYSRSFPINHIDECGIYFVSCVGEVQVSMTVHTEMYNIRPEDGKPDFLSVGQSRLPSLYSTFAVLYLIFSIVWIFS